MGPEVAATALPLIVGGTALQMQGQREQRRDRSRILNRAMDDAEQAQTMAVQTVTDEGEMLAPERRMADMQQAEDAAYERSMGDIAGIDITPSQGAGAVSEAFEQLRARRSGEESARMSAVARELAKLRAPGMVQTDGAMRRGAMSEALGSMFNSQRARTNAAQFDADSVDMPMYGQIGQMIGGIGQMGLMGGGGQANITNPAPISTANIRWTPGGR